MTHTTAEMFDALVDALIALLAANLEALGATAVIEGDELPSYVDPGTIYVVPLVEGEDEITFHGGRHEPPQGDHRFPITVAGFFYHRDISSGLRPTRGYGFNCLDLLGVQDMVLAGDLGDGTVMGEVYDPRLSAGYMRIGDRVLHFWMLKITVETR